MKVMVFKNVIFCSVVSMLIMDQLFNLDQGITISFFIIQVKSVMVEHSSNLELHIELQDIYFFLLSTTP
jgi:hypothetical protein